MESPSDGAIIMSKVSSRNFEASKAQYQARLQEAYTVTVEQAVCALAHYDRLWAQSRCEFVGPCPKCGESEHERNPRRRPGPADRFGVNNAKRKERGGVYHCRVCHIQGFGGYRLVCDVLGIDYKDKGAGRDQVVELLTGSPLPPFKPCAPPDLGKAGVKSWSVEPREMPTPIWDAYFAEFCGWIVALSAFQYRWFGYGLTGSRKEQAFVFFHGCADTGKGVLFDTIRGIMGDYAVVAPMETFTESRGGFDRHPVEREVLRHGVRQVFASETKKERRWNEQLIKEITGEDEVQSRGMRQAFTPTRPACKLTFAGNWEPQSSSDDSMRKRLRLIKANNKPKNVDRELRTRLKDEWPGIAWKLVQGCLEWQRSGLQAPPAVTAASREYFDAQDVMAQWAEDYIEPHPSGKIGFAYRTDLWRSWEQFAMQRKEAVGTRQAFREWMEKRYGEQSLMHGLPIWRGIRLRRPAV
jgi:P4 family phage/plasmid primase-like protien